MSLSRKDCAAIVDGMMDRACRSIVSGIDWDDYPRHGMMDGRVRFNRAGCLGDVAAELIARSPGGRGTMVIRSESAHGNGYPKTGRKIRGKLRYGGGRITWRSKHVTDDVLARAAVLGIRAKIAPARYTDGTWGDDYDIAVILPRSRSANPLSLAAAHIALSGRHGGIDCPGRIIGFRNYEPDQSGAPPGFYSDGDDDDELPF